MRIHATLRAGAIGHRERIVSLVHGPDIIAVHEDIKVGPGRAKKAVLRLNASEGRIVITSTLGKTLSAVEANITDGIEA